MEGRLGSCACGSIAYRLNSEIRNVVNCHCNMCRKHNGSAFSTYVALPFEAFEIIKGEDKLEKYRVHSGQKHFCSSCGTPMYNLNGKYPGACMVYFGTLEDSNEITPRINVWCESKLSWVENLATINGVPEGI